MNIVIFVRHLTNPLTLAGNHKLEAQFNMLVENETECNDLLFVVRTADKYEMSSASFLMKMIQEAPEWCAKYHAILAEVVEFEWKQNAFKKPQ